MMRTYDSIKRAEEGIETFIGKDRLNQYRDLFPVMALLYYRTYYETDSERTMESVKWSDIFIPLGIPGWKSLLHFFGSYILYIYVWIITLGKKSAFSSKEGVFVFSNTFSDNQRYPAVRKQIEEFCGFQTIVCVCNALKFGEGSINKSLWRSLTWNHGSYRPIFFGWTTIAGKRLHKAAENWCKALMDWRNGKQIRDEEIDHLLEDLRKTYSKRHRQLKKRLINRNIKAYVTVNQYNLRDILIIHACKEIGIRTIQLEHHAMQFSRANFSVTKKMPRYAFAQEYYLWSESEKKFHEKVFTYENILGNNNLSFHVIGNLELTYSAACNFIRKYPVQRRLTYMTSAIDDTLLVTQEQIQEVKNWRWNIFEKLRSLMEKQNIIIRIRYTPFNEAKFRREEIPVLKQWGFEISKSVPENLMEDMCSSLAVMSTTSTVLATSRILGRKTFRLEDPAMEYIQVDPGIIDISLADITTIVLDESCTVDQLDPKDFFQVDRLLS